MEEDKVIGGKAGDLSGARRILTMDISITSTVTRVMLGVRTVSWRPSDPQRAAARKSSRQCSMVTLDLELGGYGRGIENVQEAAVRTTEPPPGPVVQGYETPARDVVSSGKSTVFPLEWESEGSILRRD